MGLNNHNGFNPKMEYVRRRWPLVALLLLAFILMIHLYISMLSQGGISHGGSSTWKSSSASVGRIEVEVGMGTDMPGLLDIQQRALIHYATTNVTPQLTFAEVSLVGSALAACGSPPCNFLVFGLGFDSLLWAALNRGGKTVFLEEDSTWIELMAKKGDVPLTAHHVHYPTELIQADELLLYARSSTRDCRPVQKLQQSRCKLALTDLPIDIYNTNWDVILVDAPRGYFSKAPGRMTAIFSASVMGRRGNKRNYTDIFLHDVDRRVEDIYGREFLCRENLVASEGLLWHFQVPVDGLHSSERFCSITS